MPKITELNELSSAFSGCKIPIVDPNDPTQGASGTTKYINWQNLEVDKILSQKIGNVDLGVLGSGSITLDLASGDFFYGIQTGNLTIDITGVSTSINNVELDLLMSGAGSYTISLPASFQSLAATAPTIYSTTGQHNIFVAQTTDSGVNWQYALAGGSA